MMVIIRIIFWIAVTFPIHYYLIMPAIYKNRADELHLLQFKSSENDFVEKDSIVISGFELHYLRTGSFDSYKGY